MEVLAGALAVLVPAAFVLRELARPDEPAPPTTPTVARPAPRELAIAVTTVDLIDERPVALPEEPAAASQLPTDPRAPVEADPEAAPAPGFAHAPVSAPATAPEAVAVRAPSRSRPVTPRPEQDRSTVLGVFDDTEPDRRTEGARRAASALVLAAVTAAVATGVGGVIYLGLSRLG
ncbi:MAG TPA: hypothetical protein VNA14_04175 [Mycobacteriales bacterium]|nr:hypothetical protein [Mycobacteriales bacterium]